MSTLREIIQHKRKETEQRKGVVSVTQLKKSPLFTREAFSLVESLTREGSTGIIAEFKRSSPSRGFIHAGASPGEIVRDYEIAGASGISILTDEVFFSGSLSHLRIARDATTLPILRKDFILDEYQIIEAKAMGADVILLIAAVLDQKKINTFTSLTKELGMEVLFEIHEGVEITKIPERADIIGVNNRNLKTFEVDVRQALELASLLPSHKVRIAESGISEPATVRKLRKSGYRGFLIGETFMKTNDPGKACLYFIKQLNRKRTQS